MADLIVNGKHYLIAFAGGILPALIWLWFWLREDREAPEPRGLIALSFAAGMAVVYFVLPIQKLAVLALPGIMDALDMLGGLWQFIS